MRAKGLDVERLLAVKDDCHNLWYSFEQQLIHLIDRKAIRPLYQLTDWHTYLLITSEVIGGIVDNGKRYSLIKGKTMKTQQIKNLQNENDEFVATQHRDRFETLIKAIDLTYGSPYYSQILEIR